MSDFEKFVKDKYPEFELTKWQLRYADFYLRKKITGKMILSGGRACGKTLIKNLIKEYKEKNQ
jgi:hypothetical protein